MKYLLSLFLLLVSIISVYQSVRANDQSYDTWTVCASGCDFSTIASAVTDVQVNDGDTLDLAGETFPEHDILLDKDLTIIGVGQQITIIDAESVGRVFSVTLDTTVAVHNLTITGGLIEPDINDPSPAPQVGGGIYNFGSLSLYNVGVEKNESKYFACGGGIFNAEQAELFISDSLFADNVARLNGNGGAICNPGNAIIETTIFTGNSASWGGGAITSGGTLTLTRSVFEENDSQWDIFYNLGIASVSKSAFVGNSAIGGAVINNEYLLTLVNTTVSQNNGSGLISCCIYDQLNASYVTISDNSEYGIYVIDTLTAENSIIAHNGYGDCYEDIVSLGATIDSDSSCGLNQASDLPGINPGLAILGDYGGNTYTHALLTTSPALEAGVNCGTVTEDQRGFPRPIGVTCDIGAFEGIIPFSQYAYMPVTLK